MLSPANRCGRARRAIRSILHFAVWLDNHWIGDALGVACLFGLLGVSLFFAGAYQ